MLAPDYELIRELGFGDMGTVYLARDVALDVLVAVKVLRPELATATAVERFVREARILAQLRHPNIVAVHKVAERGGLHFYTMDYLDADTLRARLERHGRLGHEEARSGAICWTRSRSPAYLAPEQFASIEATERTDIYAAGMVLPVRPSRAAPHQPPPAPGPHGGARNRYTDCEQSETATARAAAHRRRCPACDRPGTSLLNDILAVQHRPGHA